MAAAAAGEFDPATMIDAGRYIGGAGGRDDCRAVADGSWVTGTAAALAAVAPASLAGGLQFETVPLEQFAGWLRRSAALPVAEPWRRFPRVELPVGEDARRFLKNLDHGLIATWLDRVEATAQATGRTPARGLLLVAAGDFTRAALDLRHLLSRHNPRKGKAAGRRRLALLLDSFGVDGQGNWQAAMRLGLHFPVFVLARGVPGGLGPDPASAAPTAWGQAEAIYHGVVGELGTERILFGSGAPAGRPETDTATQAAAAWFAAPRPWLDTPSLGLLFGGNARRVLAADPGSLDPQPAAEREPLETVREGLAEDPATGEPADPAMDAAADSEAEPEA